MWTTEVFCGNLFGIFFLLSKYLNSSVFVEFLYYLLHVQAKPSNVPNDCFLQIFRPAIIFLFPMPGSTGYCSEVRSNSKFDRTQVPRNSGDQFLGYMVCSMCKGAAPI